MIKKTGAAALAVILGMIILVGWFSREPVDAPTGRRGVEDSSIVASGRLAGGL